MTEAPRNYGIVEVVVGRGTGSAHKELYAIPMDSSSYRYVINRSSDHMTVLADNLTMTEALSMVAMAKEPK